MNIVVEQVQAALADGQAVLRGEAANATTLPLSYNGVATYPQVVQRRFVGLMVDVLVPPGMTAILSGPKGLQRILPTGSYQLWDIPRGPVQVQWVATNRQRRTIGPIEGWSADKWRVRVGFTTGSRASPAAMTTWRTRC